MCRQNHVLAKSQLRLSDAVSFTVAEYWRLALQHLAFWVMEIASAKLRFAAHMCVIAKAVACHSTAAPATAAPSEPCPDSPYPDP